MADDTRFPRIDEDARLHLQSISVCREPTCPVVKKQPFYPVPVDPPLYHGQRPCLPVVPTYVTKGKVMLIGEYPNCRFTTQPDPQDAAKVLLAPVADINEPFESGRYFDGRTVVNYPTGESLRKHYLEPLGLSLEDDVWFTNVVKCFLIKATHMQVYKQFGWPAQWRDPNSGATRALRPAYNDYFEIASICAREHLEREVDLCQPKLIIAFGERVSTACSTDDQTRPRSLSATSQASRCLPVRFHILWTRAARPSPAATSST